MAVITVGYHSTIRHYSPNNGVTYISGYVPANGSGVITAALMYVYADITGLYLATAFGSGNDYEIRDYTYVGSTSASTARTITGLDIDVEPGDFSAYYHSGGSSAWRQLSGPVRWYKTGNYITGSGEETYSTSSNGWVFNIKLTGATNTIPTAPTSLLCEGSTNPTGVTDLTPEFSAIFNDPDSGDESNAIEIHVGETNDPENSPDLWDSGTIAETVTEGDRSSDITYDGDALSQLGQTIYWCCRFRDDDDAWGAWSAVASLTFAPKDVSVSDSGAGTDIVASIQAALEVSDSGAGTDLSSRVDLISILDSGIGTDIVSAVQAAIGILEEGLGSDSISSIQATLGVSDSGSGIDSITVQAELAVLDSGIGVDSITVGATLTVSDSGSGTDSLGSITIAVSLLDDGIGSDAITEVLSAVSIADSGVGSELLSILANIEIADGGSGTDLLSLIQSLVSISDSGIGSEAPIVVLNWKPTADLTVTIDYRGPVYDGSGNAILYDGSGNAILYDGSGNLASYVLDD